jgi:lactoylglutathione lyase
MKTIAALTAALLAGTPLSGAEPTASRQLPAFDHVAINVADQQRSVDFYSGAFGLKEIAAPFPSGGPRWMALAGGIALHLQSLPEKPAPPPRAVHFAISVADLAPVIAYLRGHRIVWTDAQGRPGKVQAIRTDGVRQLYVQDPDGYWIEVNDKLKRD